MSLIPAETLSSSPSRQDGVDASTELAQRIWGCELIEEAGILLRLPQVVMCTAQNLLHRFYYRKSLTRFDSLVVAMGCFFLACKIEENPKRIRELIYVFHYVWRCRDRSKKGSLELGGPRYNGWKAEIVKIERHILKELGFSFYVIEHPHKFILFYVKILALDHDRNFAQIAWNYLNDVMRLDFCLRYRSEVVACAAIFMAARDRAVKLPVDPVCWWDVFHVDKAQLDDVVSGIVQLYNRAKVAWLPSLAPGPRITDDDFDHLTQQ